MDSDCDVEEPLMRSLVNNEETKVTPLPRTQLAVLCSLRLLDPLSFSQIFPYINNLMEDLHLTQDPSQIGFYSGLVESTFAISQLCAVYPWAWTSDTFGRRPIILSAAAGLGVSTIIFGLSSTLSAVLLSRALAGIFSGNVSVIPSVLCEITDRTNQATAFPIFGLFWPIGAVIGPLIGGNLSNPAQKYPDWFNYKVFRTFPHSLPCFATAAIIFITLFWSYLFLKESLPTRIDSQASVGCSYGATRDTQSSTIETPSFRQLLAKPIVRALCISGFALGFVTTAFDVLFVLFCFTPINVGGLAFSESQIGYALAISGTLAASLQLFFMPTLLRRFDHAKLYSFCSKTWPFTFMSLPLLNVIARRGVDEAGELAAWSVPVIWTGVAITLSMARIGYLGYSVNMLLVKRHAPPYALATTNGLVQFFICFSRAFSPAFVSSAFALSTNRQFFGGHFWVVIMVIICISGSYVSKSIVRLSIP